MNVVAIIPARFGATRFPGKPLAKETGKFLIQHVYEQASKASHIDQCVVATDDQRIMDAVASFGGDAVMTRPDHPSGTDRLAEVVAGAPGHPTDIVLNVQGDEPEIDPNALDRLVMRLEADNSCPMATLACPFPKDADPADPNCVKVVKNLRGHALYFSRSMIPYPRESQDRGLCDNTSWLLHLGVYAYRRSFLLEYAAWTPTPLETIEKLEQLRVLEHGYSIAIECVEHASIGIDTPEDYARFVQRQQSE